MNDQESIVCCPSCNGELEPTTEGYSCRACELDFPRQNQIADFIIDERFDDEHDECKWLNEENTGEFLAKNYLLPLLQRLFGDRPHDQIRILSVGCGVGMDVKTLNEAGYRCYGIDPGNRTAMWEQRPNPERYFLANAKHLPFSGEAFDFAFLNCVLPHIGVAGDTNEVTPSCDAERLQAVRETVRVMTPGGYIMLGSPNRLCPLDLFHRPDGRRHWPRIHLPTERFLLSYGDHADYFVDRAGCRNISSLPVQKYWGFFLSSRYALGRMLQGIMRSYFALLSRPYLGFMRRSPLNPWLVTLVQK